VGFDQQALVKAGVSGMVFQSDPKGSEAVQPLGSCTDGITMAKLKLDLHDIYNRGAQIDAELNRIVQEALDKKIALIEIIPGKAAVSSRRRCCGF